jgi:hypothetical protein
MVKVKITLEQAMKACGGGKGMAVLFLGTRWGWVVNMMPWLLHFREKYLVVIVQGAWGSVVVKAVCY